MSDRSDKLKPEERSLYRRVYLARVHESASVEGADRQAMQTVKIWHDRGAFGERAEEATPDTALCAGDLFASPEEGGVVLRLDHRAEVSGGQVVILPHGTILSRR